MDASAGVVGGVVVMVGGVVVIVVVAALLADVTIASQSMRKGDCVVGVADILVCLPKCLR